MRFIARAQLAGLVLGVSIVAALTALRASDPEMLKSAREAVFDEFQRISPRPFESMPVRIVDIDEASLQEFGQWPWPRNRLATLVERLTDAGVAAIAFDIVFAEPDRLSPRTVVQSVPGIDPSLVEKLPDNDEIFANAIANAPVVLGFGLTNQGGYRPPVKAGFAFTGEDPANAPPHLTAGTPLLPQFTTSAAGIGHISLNPGDPSAVVRTVPLFLSDGQQLYPNLAIEALRVAQGASTYVLADAPDVPGTISDVKIGDFIVPVTAAGELWLYVTADRAERYISARELLGASDIPADIKVALEGAIVFVGTSAAGLQDIRTNALGQNVPGVSLHAQTVEQILSGHYLSRPDWTNGLEILAIALLGCLLVVLTVFVSPGVALGCGLLLTALSLVGSWLAFSTFGLLIDPLAPIVAGTITHFAVTSFRFLVTDRQRLAIRHAFGQYLSPALLHRIENTPDALRLGGDERELTVMFVDIRGFTSISEKLSPTGLVDFLNALLDALSRHVTDNEGTLDKFIGDSIMAFWNAPVDVEDHARKALRAALGMRHTLARLNAEDAFGFGEGRAVAIGVGIHTGLACVGNMGAESRFNYSAVGDAVNIASRIESSCKEMACDILVSESSASTAPDFAVLEAGELALRGRSASTAVFAVVGDEQVAASPEFSALRSLHGELVTKIRSRTQVDTVMVETAAAAGEKLDKGLARFFRRMVERAEHFRQG